MSSNSRVQLLVLMVLAFCGVYALAADGLNPAPATQPAPMVGEVNIQTMAAKTYFFRSKQTTFAELGKAIEELIPALMTTLKQNAVPVDGPVIMVYRGVAEDNSLPFTLDVGIVVTDAAQPVGDFQVRKLEAFHCATVLYTGPVSSMKKAFDKAMPVVFQNQQTPTGELREYYLYWEGPESANNVVQAMVGVK